MARPLKHFRPTLLSAQRLKSQFAFRWVVASSSPVELLGWDCTRTREQIAMPQIERRRDGHVSRACTYVLTRDICHVGMYTRVRTRMSQNRANEVTASISSCGLTFGKPRLKWRNERTRICYTPAIRSLYYRVLLILSSSTASIFGYTWINAWYVLAVALSPSLSLPFSLFLSLRELIFLYYINANSDKILHSFVGNMNYYHGRSKEFCKNYYQGYTPLLYFKVVDFSIVICNGAYLN